MEEMTTNEVEEGLKRSQTVIIPVGVMEAHGPHLPLATDTFEAYDSAKRAAELTDVFVAPPIPYGMCRSTAGHAGTVGIRGDTLRALVRDIVASLANSGFRNFLLYSGHASTIHLAALEEAGESLIREYSINVAVVSDYHVVKERAAAYIETEGDLHAGEIETSRMMYILPNLVRTDLLPPEGYRKIPRPMLVPSTRKYWQVTVDGNPRIASAEKGRQYSDAAVQYLVELVREMNEFRAD
jgi:creatinine amidohydrolase